MTEPLQTVRNPFIIIFVTNCCPFLSPYSSFAVIQLLWRIPPFHRFPMLLSAITFRSAFETELIYFRHIILPGENGSFLSFLKEGILWICYTTLWCHFTKVNSVACMTSQPKGFNPSFVHIPIIILWMGFVQLAVLAIHNMVLHFLLCNYCTILALWMTY